jgi:hypothetical protein
MISWFYELGFAFLDNITKVFDIAACLGCLLPSFMAAYSILQKRVNAYLSISQAASKL